MESNYRARERPVFSAKALKSLTLKAVFADKKLLFLLGTCEVKISSYIQL